MTGWKTWGGAAVLAIAAGLEVRGYEQFAAALMTVGAALGMVGIGHKIEKAK